MPDAKSYEGRTAFADAGGLANAWEDFRIDLLEVIDAGDDVCVSVTRHRGRGSGSGIEMDFQVFYVQHGRNGKSGAY